MNLNDLALYKPDLNKLTKEMNSFCEKYAITKLEPEDIIELLADGEDVDWIVDQLQAENSKIDAGALSSLLNNIKSIVASAEEKEEVAEGMEKERFVVEPELPSEMLDLNQLDLSQLSELSLPPGMKLPPGIDMKQIQQIMQSPQGKFLEDFSMFCHEKGLDDIQGTLSNPEKIQELNQEWMSTPRPAFEGKTPAEILADNPAIMSHKVETYRREEPRVGRNDPCPCGSGKKYKKCCGKRKDNEKRYFL